MSDGFDNERQEEEMGRIIRMVPPLREPEGDPEARRKELFVEALRNTGIVRSACATVGWSRNKAHRMRTEDEIFRNQWDQALEDAADMLEEEARNRAFNGSDTLLIFLLKGLRPEKWNDRVRHEHFNKGPQEIVFKVVHELQKQPDVQLDVIDATEGSYHQLTGPSREADSGESKSGET